MPGYKYLNHTADLGIEVTGKTLENLFINTAKAIFDTQIKGRILAKEDLTLKLKSSSLQELYIDWCRELLYNFSVKWFIPKKYKLLITANKNLVAHLVGDRFDKKRHSIKLEIKNPTYHNLSLKKIKDHYIASIIFDV